MNTCLFAQHANNDIAKGNEAYRKHNYATAIESYKNALRKEPENNTARFNLANALQKKDETEQSEKDYDEIIKSADVSSLKSESNYNKALAFLKEKNLKNAIDAFRESLKENPSDDDTRENLQKAMNEYKQQQQNQPKPKDQPRPQNQKPQKQPPINKQMMQQKFDELRNQEKQLQKKLQNKYSSGDQAEDW